MGFQGRCEPMHVPEEPASRQPGGVGWEGHGDCGCGMCIGSTRRGSRAPRRMTMEKWQCVWASARTTGQRGAGGRHPDGELGCQRR